MIGVLSTIGSQVSLFAMAGLSTVRLNGIRGSLRVPGEIDLFNSLKVALGVFFLVLTSVAIAIAPMIGALEDFFVNGVKFSDQLRIFTGTPSKQRILSVLEAYYGRMKDATLSWEMLLKMVKGMFSEDKGHIDYTKNSKKLDFYGNDGVCLFKYFVKNDDPQKEFVWVILVINFVCFLFISISYLLIIVVSKISSERIAGTQNKNQINQRNRKLNMRIAIIIATDFCCWVPFIIICALHFLDVLDATPWYSLFSMIILPINAVINPFLYDDVVREVLCKLFRIITSTASSSAIYRSFRTQFSTTRSEVIEMEQQDVRGGKARPSAVGNVRTRVRGASNPNRSGK